MVGTYRGVNTGTIVLDTNKLYRAAIARYYRLVLLLIPRVLPHWDLFAFSLVFPIVARAYRLAPAYVSLRVGTPIG